MVTGKGFQVVIPILAELLKSLVPQEVPVESTHQKVGRPNLNVLKALEVAS